MAFLKYTCPYLLFKKKLGHNLLEGMVDGLEVDGNKLGFMEGLGVGDSQ
jgi:hypothetical protein